MSNPTRILAARLSLVCLILLLATFAFINRDAQANASLTNNDSPRINSITSAEEEIVREINAARTNPQQYATFIEQTRRNYNGNRLVIPGRAAFITNEGVSAVDEAINYLRAATPLPGTQLSRGMSSAARDHAADVCTGTELRHNGSDGSNVATRVNRYGTWNNGIAENIYYMTGSARELVMAWIIDDGVAGRPHRNNIFNPRYRFIGVALSGQSTPMGSVCVTTFAGGYTEREAATQASPAATTTAAPRTSTPVRTATPTGTSNSRRRP